MDKNKIIQAATKLVQKGQFDKAIKEYQKIIDEDPKDIRILQKVGELHQKRGDNAQAAQTFIKVAEAYSNDGFFLKAAAVYKQVLKLNPNLVETNFKLAELYQQLGLMSDALQQYQLVAAAYDRQGDAQASLNILKKLVELDSENVANRIRLAESYSREGMNDEAVAEFTKVADFLKQNHRADEYVKVAERLAFLDPQNMGLCRELANVYLAKGDTKRALAKLQICFKADPRDVETLTLLAQAFKDLGQAAKTVSVYKELAKIYAEADRLDDEEAVWRKVGALAPDDSDYQSWQESRGIAPEPSVRSAPAPSSPQPAPSPRASPSTAGRGLGPEAIPKLLTEMDVYLKYGLHAKAAEHLKKILSLAPNNPNAHERARDLYLTMGDEPRAAEEIVTLVQLALEAGDRERAQADLQQLQELAPEHPQLQELSEALGRPTEIAEVSDDAILVEASDEDVLLAAEDAPEEVSADDLVEEEPAAADEALFDAPASEEPAEVGAEEDEALALDGTSEEMALVTADDADALVEESPEDLGMEEDVGEAPAPVETPFDTDPDGNVVAEEATTIAHMPSLAEDDEVAATQAYDREALLAEAFRSAPVPVPVARPAARAPVIVPPAPTRAASRAPPPVQEEEPEELAEVEFFIEQQLWDEAEEVLGQLRVRAQRNPGLRARLQALEQRLEEARSAPPPEASGSDEQFDLAAELEREVTADPAAPAETDDFQYSVEDVLREFKKGVERTVRPEDVETHYDLGIAYKEMGLVDEAIGEFEQAAAGAQGKPREADCLAMIGLCATGKGDAARAADVYERALAVAGLRPETQLNLYFELGTAQEEIGDATKALSAYERVAAIDPNYRDVKVRIGKLRPQGGGPGKSRKVGYL
ncbi:MAG TPA: tetratricopeptide repeat protein [Myxococcales bacterium]|nr:tetratricopeptide repeat protein [Myxococcales bacterium]